MQVKRATYTNKQAIQKYQFYCNITGKEPQNIKEVKQDGELISLFNYDNQLVYAFTPEILQSNHSFAVGRI